MTEETFANRPLHEIKASLKQAMQEELACIKDVLANMDQEQDAILESKVEVVKELMKARDPLLLLMMRAREKRQYSVKELEKALEPHKKKGIKALLKRLDEEDGELKEIFAETVALLKKIEVLNDRNSYLLQNKIEFNKSLINKFQVDEPNTIYDQQGVYGKKKKKAKLALIDHEG